MNINISVTGGIGFEVDLDINDINDNIKELFNENDFMLVVSKNISKDIKFFVLVDKPLREIAKDFDSIELQLRKFLVEREIKIISEFKICIDTAIHY